jgi:SpoVK/Ycf46/Vps4 family AAA+-type ATPase
MAAEVLAAKLKLPMYRVDLSQVVNKYIGETEKNLRVLFDAAEQADLLLFFDEADALFGQRTAVKSSNDRWANLEVSYLLERMENFRGLAVLGTNRKKDLDEAFLRRLRYVIEFPMPGEHERLNIWRKAIPCQVEAAEVDLEFLAAEYALAGGNIRSIVLNACLQAAARSVRPRLDMETVMRAIAREYEKLGRPLTVEQTERWIPAVEMAVRNGAMRGMR